MTNTLAKNEEIVLVSVKDGKYLVKIKNLGIPISLNEYLYKKWIYTDADISPESIN
jgi:hypothetical protein